MNLLYKSKWCVSYDFKKCANFLFYRRPLVLLLLLLRLSINIIIIIIVVYEVFIEYRSIYTK
jgi:hypothetical protein